MQVTIYSLDGQPESDRELLQDEQSQLWLDGVPVLAVSFWGAKVALTLTERLVLIDLDAYGRLTKYSKLLAPDQEQTQE
jgi:hypothetical protein